MQTKYQIEINVREAGTGEVVERWGSTAEWDTWSAASAVAKVLAKTNTAIEGAFEAGDDDAEAARVAKARELHGARVSYRQRMNRPWLNLPW
jgi:hypothetical protein